MYFCPLCTRVYAGPGACPDDGATLHESVDTSQTDSSAELVGQQIGSYRIERLIGKGGMGEVYLAVQPDIGSRVAIKILSQAQGRGSAGVDRFFAEARSVNLIRHEALVNILDLAKMPDGRPYIVMEYLEGAPLSSHIARGPIALATLTRWMGELLDALAAAHATGIIHRDLKPDNVFITTLARVKVLDFGIAKLKPELSSNSPETQAGAILGTPHYMSPEQARGQPVDHRSDLYSAGVILFECATGRRLFDATALYELLHLHITGAPPIPSSLRPEIPPTLDAVIARALAKDPAHRFQTALEMRQALDAVAQGLSVENFASVPVPARTASIRPALTVAGETLDATSIAGVPKKSFALPIVLGMILAALLTAGLVTTLFVLYYRPNFRGVKPPLRNADPTRYDPDHFDMTAYLPIAKRRAQKEYPDARLIGMAGMDIGADGTAKLAPDRVVSYLFRSPSHTPRRKTPDGPVMGDCVVAVSVTSRDSYVVRSQGACDTPILPEPRCSIQHVMKRSGLPEGMRASAHLAVMNGKLMWNVARSGNRDTPLILPDDC